MKLEEPKVKDKSIFSVIKVIRQDIEKKTCLGNLSDKDAIMGYLSGIKAFLRQRQPPLEQAETTENKEISEDEKEQIEILNKCWVKLKLVENKKSKHAEMVQHHMKL